MSSDLATYLQDHVAGATAAVEVIALLQKHSDEPVLTQLLTWLVVEVQEDKATLEAFASGFATCPSSLKNAAASAGVAIVGLKTRAGNGPFGALEGLEFLCLAIQGKLHLWKALDRGVLCATAPNKPGFSLLIKRAEIQHRKVDALRLAIATIAL